MKAAVVIAHDLLRPWEAERHILRRRRRIRALVPAGRRALVILNGRPLLRRSSRPGQPPLPAGTGSPGWRRRLADGDHLAIILLPEGGGAGGSDPLRTLLSIALLVVAGPLAGWLVPAGGLLAKAAQAAILLGGQVLLNVLMPPPKPPKEPGDVFALTAQGNAARLEAPLPVQYGRLRVAPDFAAAPWAEAAGNEHFLYLLYCLGAGAYEIEDIRIGDVTLEAFGEVEVEVVEPGGQVTLFPTAVFTSPLVSGQEMRGLIEADFTRAGTTVTVEEEGHRRASGQTVRVEAAGEAALFAAVAAVPDEDHWTFEAPGWSAASGKADIWSVLGGAEGFPAAGSGAVATAVGVDLLWPAGLANITDTGKLSSRTTEVRWQARRIGDDDAPLGNWMDLGDVEVTDKTRTPQRRSWRFPLDPHGRWAVRGWRLDARSGDDKDAHDVHWAGLRGYLTEAQDWPAVTLIAMRMRATGNLSRQASRSVLVTATRKLPVWDGTAWSAPVATRSIAWALADMARAADYGPGLGDNRIDLAGLAALDALWAARGDACDIRFTAEETWWEAAQKVAICGRARMLMQGGRLRAVRDGPETIPVALFSQRNIVEGSFGIDYLMPGPATADAVEVSYLDAATWRPERVTAALPGSTVARPATIRLEGVTSRAQALREGLYHAACARYRRRIIRLATEMEGFIPAPGDLIAVQHDLVGWGAHAEATAWDGGALRLTLSEPVDWSGEGHVVGLRRRDGTLAGPVAVSRGGHDAELLLAADPGIIPDTGQGRLRTHVAIGRGESWRAPARVVGLRPRDALVVEIEAVVEDPSVHTAETGAIAPPLRLSALPRLADAPAVAGLAVRLAPDATAFLAWAPAAGATHYEVEMAEGGARAGDSPGWTRAVDTAAAAVTLRPPWGPRSRFRVRAIGRAAGPWAEVQAGIARPLLWRAREDNDLDHLWLKRATDILWGDRATTTLWGQIREPA